MSGFAPALPRDAADRAAPMPARSGDGAVVELRDCVKTLRSSDAEFRLEVEDLTLRTNEFVGVFGKSGSGKSTLLDILSLASSPDEIGAYRLAVDGGVVDLAEPIRRGDDALLSSVRLNHFGYILQSGGLIDCLSVAENVNLVPDILDRPRHGADSPLVQRLEMEAHMGKRISALSGGQRQRVSILRALAAGPTVIVADEPTASVDENMAETIIEELKALARGAGVTVALVSHDRDLVWRYCDRIVELHPEQLGEGRVRTRVTMP